MREVLHKVDRHGQWAMLAMGAILIPGLYYAGAIDITTVNRLGRFLCFAIVALGLDMVWGVTGILSLCQAMFFCFGGYAIGMHMALHGPLDGEGIPRCLYVVTSALSFELPWFWKPFQGLGTALFLAVFLPGLAAFIFGYFAFRSRVRGVYFSIITQATTLGACLIFRSNETNLCGTNGLTNFVELGTFELGSDNVKLGIYLLTVAVLFGVYKLCSFIVGSKLGRVLIAIRDNESRLRFSGYKPLSFKIFVFTLGAVIAAIGGMLYTPQNGIITPFKMEPAESIFIVIWVAVGGRGTLSGAVIGALLVNYLYSFLSSNWASAWPFLLGLLYIATVLFFPDGIMGAWRKLLEHKEHPAAPATESDAAPVAVDAPPPNVVLTKEAKA